MKPLWLCVVALALVGCEKKPPSSGFKMYGDGNPNPHKPGDSIKKSAMCSCLACEPEACCRELEQDAPDADNECADGYDFSKCEIAVSSCESRCFQERWRTDVERGCAASRPDSGCHDQAAF